MQQESNEMGVLSYLIAHLYWGWLFNTFFTARLFCRIVNMKTGLPLSTANSQLVLQGLVFLVSILGLFSTIAHYRNSWSLLFNTLTPYGIYLLLETLPHFPIYVWINFAAVIFFVIIYSILLITAPIHQFKNKKVVIRKRFYQLVNNTRILSSFLLCGIVIVAAIGAILGFQVIKAQSFHDQSSNMDNSQSLLAYSKELQGLQNTQWESLSIQQKVNLLQLVTNIESNYLGLPDNLKIHCKNLAPDVAGNYNHKTRTISVATDLLLYNGPKDCVDTIIHEVYHSYEHHLCTVYETLDKQYQSLYFLRNAATYLYEFEHYNSGGDDFLDYYLQACEIDSREFACYRLTIYNHLLQLGWE